MSTDKPQQGNKPPAQPSQQQGSQTGTAQQQGGGQRPPRYTDWASI